jgi:DNA modification methylase
MANCIVLDPFGGSGSTLIACEQTDRICFMVELDERYCDVIVRRTVEQLQSSDNVFLVRNDERIPYKTITENSEK